MRLMASAGLFMWKLAFRTVRVRTVQSGRPPLIARNRAVPTHMTHGRIVSKSVSPLFFCVTAEYVQDLHRSDMSRKVVVCCKTSCSGLAVSATGIISGR